MLSAITVFVTGFVFLVFSNILTSSCQSKTFRDNSFDVDLPCAWSITQGSKNIVVAVIDTGIDAKHPNLTDNMWHDPQNPQVYGWDFVNNKANPADDNGHGTHVAGIIGGKTDFFHGTRGIARHVSIMSLKYFSEKDDNLTTVKHTIEAINYAVNHGAKIINYSAGGSSDNEEEYLALKNAEEHGVLVITAAGNNHNNTDVEQNKYYPAAYKLSNMISVASVTFEGKLASYSNWGKKTVDVAAMGDGVYSTLPNNRFGYFSGTSQATAVVTGIAVLLLAKHPNWTPQQIKHAIMNSVDYIPSVKNKTVSGGRANACSALRQSE